jgi:hypothetical protein
LGVFEGKKEKFEEKNFKGTKNFGEKRKFWEKKKFLGKKEKFSENGENGRKLELLGKNLSKRGIFEKTEFFRKGDYVKLRKGKKFGRDFELLGKLQNNKEKMEIFGINEFLKVFSLQKLDVSCFLAFFKIIVPVF